MTSLTNGWTTCSISWEKSTPCKDDPTQEKTEDGVSSGDILYCSRLYIITCCWVGGLRILWAICFLKYPRTVIYFKVYFYRHCAERSLFLILCISPSFLQPFHQLIATESWACGRTTTVARDSQGSWNSSNSSWNEECAWWPLQWWVGSRHWGKVSLGLATTVRSYNCVYCIDTILVLTCSCVVFSTLLHVFDRLKKWLLKM